MAIHDAGSADELAVGERKLLKINGEKILLFRLDSGYHAIQATCTHLLMPLKKGKLLDGKVLQCPIHRAEFDIASGNVVKWANFPPGIQALNIVRKEKCLKTYPASVADGQVRIEV